MKITADYIVIGSGLTGATIARSVADMGREGVVLGRRRHVGGNVHDFTHASGIRVQPYGPHYFLTNSDELWDFVRRFTSFYAFEAVLKSWVDGQYENWPIAGSYIRRAVGESWHPEFKGAPANFEEASLSMMPRVIYEQFVKWESAQQLG